MWPTTSNETALTAGFEGLKKQPFSSVAGKQARNT
jgi:hypothetical protein